MNAVRNSAFVALCLVSNIAFAQGTQQQTSPASLGPTKSSQSPSVPPGPSMKDTEKWIKRELPALGSYTILVTKSDDRSRPLSTEHRIDSAVLSDCRFTLHRTEVKFETVRLSYTETVELKDVDVSKIKTVEGAVGTGYTNNRPEFFVVLAATADRGKTFTSSMKQDGFPAQGVRPVSAIRVGLPDDEAGKRMAEVFRRAAVLCGAPAAPETGLEAEQAHVATVTTPRSQPSSTNTPAGSGPTASMASSTSTSGSMTNADVIAMVSAGLSEVVIANSIRQAAARAFDLRPSGLVALKKAKVSDSLIVVMQSAPSVAAAPPAPTATTPPKYDADLTKKYEAGKTAAALAATGCAGIEMMGLYKNEIFDRAMGGGITEWLVKIRNNTGVTKIVVFGWRDQYGEEQTAQVQIRGGEIASPRLDMTQARYIAPTADVKLVSCQ